MDWDNARLFLAVARAGQFLAAARQLHLDHATVSRRIGGLEKSLGALLFERRTNGCRLTAAGERFLSAAEKIEGEMLRAQADLSASEVEVAGTVRVGAPDGFGTLFLSPRLGALVGRHPRLNLQLVPVPRTFSLSRREADVAVAIDPPEEGRLRVRRLTDYTLHFYAAKTYLAAHGVPRALEDLPAHVLVTYVQDLIFSNALDFMPELFGPRYRRLENASAVGQAEAVGAGAGIGILHDYHARLDTRVEVVLPEVSFRRAYWIVTHEDTRDMLRVKVVSDFIAAEVDAARAIFVM